MCSEYDKHFTLARENPEPVGCLTTLNPTNHVVAEDDEEEHGRDYICAYIM